MDDPKQVFTFSVVTFSVNPPSHEIHIAVLTYVCISGG